MKLGIIGYGNLGKALLEMTDVVFILVEPKNSLEVLNELGLYDIKEKIIISFMAGITRQEIRHMLGEQGKYVKIARVMPNIAITNGNGILGITYEDTDCEIMQEIMHIFEKMGYLLKLDEASLDYVTITAASGMAFVASLMDSYQKAINTLFNNDIRSKEITLRVFENVIDMVKTENCSFDDIIKRITTRGGTTEAGLKSLNQEMITETLEESVKAAKVRSENITR